MKYRLLPVLVVVWFFLMSLVPVVKVSASEEAVLENFPLLFKDRSVLPVVGNSTRHGAFDSGANTTDIIATIDAIGPLVAIGAQVQGALLDTDVLTYPDLNWRGAYSTLDVLTVGGPRVNIVTYKYNGPPAGAWFDTTSWEVVTSTGNRYSDPQGRIAIISLVNETDRLVLVASTLTDYSTRAIGTILKNYSSYQAMLKGMSVIFVPVDDNGDGTYQAGESVTTLETVPIPEFTTLALPTVAFAAVLVCLAMLRKRGSSLARWEPHGGTRSCLCAVDTSRLRPADSVWFSSPC